jgi:UDP-GlcNAc:undecaprenyl-phosphate GlcNAc-1-phosphate transferase
MKQTMTVKDLVSEETPISLAIDNNEKSDGLSSGMSALGWTYLLFLLVLPVSLLLPQTRNFFLLSGWRWAYVMLVSFVVSFSLNPLCSWAAFKLNILDRPDGRKLHQHATPLLGGTAGVIDDVKELSAGIKLITQIICTVMIVSSGIILRVIPDTFGLVGLVGNAILTVIWIIGITNAMNFFDGMDGLAGGLGALISFFLGVVAFQTNQPFLGSPSEFSVGRGMQF